MRRQRPHHLRLVASAQPTAIAPRLAQRAEAALPDFAGNLRATLELARRQRHDLSLISGVCLHHPRGERLLTASAVVAQLLDEAVAWLDNADVVGPTPYAPHV